MGRRPWTTLGRDDAGFSLLEAVVSLVILGILLGLAFSGRSLIDNRRLAGAARALGTEVRWAEQRARAERRCWRMVFNTAADTYVIEYLAGGVWTVSLGCSGGAWTAYTAAARTLPSRMDLVSTTFTGNVLEVTAFGIPTLPAPTATIVLRSPGGEQRRVIINAGGMVTITR